MTSEHEGIAEKIIRLHKEKNGHLNWTVLFEKNRSLFSAEIDNEERWLQQEYIKNILVEHGLIKVINETGDQTQLIPGADDFKTFKKLRTRKSIRDFPKQYWWVLVLVSYFAGCMTDLIRDKISQKTSSDTQKSQPTIPTNGHNLPNIRDSVSYKNFDKPNQKKKE